MPFHRPPTLSAKRKRDLADQAALTAKAVASAVEFTATIFSRGGYLTSRHASLADARAAGPDLERQAANGRRAMVYAVTPDGFTHFVSPDFNPGEKR